MNQNDKNTSQLIFLNTSHLITVICSNIDKIIAELHICDVFHVTQHKHNDDKLKILYQIILSLFS